MPNHATNMILYQQDKIDAQVVQIGALKSEVARLRKTGGGKAMKVNGGGGSAGKVKSMKVLKRRGSK